MTDDFPLKDETYQVLGACFEVYNEMGCGFLESVYQECLEKELTSCGIPFEAQQSIDLVFKGQELQRTFSPDLLCFGKVIVELKAVRRLAAEHRAQTHQLLESVPPGGRSVSELRFLPTARLRAGHQPKRPISINPMTGFFFLSAFICAICGFSDA